MVKADVEMALAESTDFDDFVCRLKKMGYEAFGGTDSPYIWMQTPHGMGSWEFFDYLLSHAQVVGTPGVGFGPSGAGYFRLTGFGTREQTEEALERIRKL